MRQLRYFDKMVELLKDLKKNYGVVGIKAEFEAEGSRFNELIFLKDVINRADLGLYIKIGGCEAVRDILDCEVIGVEGIIAPMIESKFALCKYVNMAKNYIPSDQFDSINLGITFETKTAHKYIDDIINCEEFDYLKTFTIGRSDYSSSQGIEKKDINSSQMSDYVADIFKKVKSRKDMILCMGGTISVEAIDFIKVQSKNGLQRFETRKIIFEIGDDWTNGERGLELAMEFEYLWLVNKKEY